MEELKRRRFVTELADHKYTVGTPISFRWINNYLILGLESQPQVAHAVLHSICHDMPCLRVFFQLLLWIQDANGRLYFPFDWPFEYEEDFYGMNNINYAFKSQAELNSFKSSGGPDVKLYTEGAELDQLLCSKIPHCVQFGILHDYIVPFFFYAEERNLFLQIRSGKEEVTFVMNHEIFFSLEEFLQEIKKTFITYLFR